MKFFPICRESGAMFISGRCKVRSSKERVTPLSGKTVPWTGPVGSAVPGTSRTVRSVVGIGYDVTQEVKSSSEKDLLMRELNHRIKNNLNIIASLISLKDSEIEEDLSDIVSRIHAIRIIHEKLQRSESMSDVGVREYFLDLLETIFSNFSRRKVEVQEQIEDMLIPTRIAIPLGLLVNEVATNAIKHGFCDDRPARFTVSFAKNHDNGRLLLVLSNNGRFFPENIRFDNPDTLGLQLIDTLIKQLEGSCQLQRSPTPRFEIEIPAV